MKPIHVSRFAAVSLVFALYAATMCRWIGAGDTAIVVWNMDQAILSSHVNNHPAMVGIGWVMMQVMPWGTPAWQANWFSVLFSTLYLGLFHVVISRWLRDPVHALLATLLLAVTHAVWWHATIVENYALNGVSLLTVTWLLLRDHETGNIRYLYGASLVAGLAVLNHAQMGFLAPVLGAYAAVRDPFELRTVVKRWALLALGWFIGLTPWLGLLARNIVRGNESKMVVKNAVGSHFTAIMFDLRIMELGSVIWRELLVQFPSPTLLLLPFGVWFAFRHNPRWKVHVALGTGFVVNTGFFLLYHTWDRFAFLLPSFVILVIWLTEAWAVALERTRDRMGLRRLIVVLALVGIAMPPMVYRELPRIGRAGLFWHGRFSSNSQWNTHDVASYLANPDKSGWNDLHRVNKLLLEQLPPRSVVIDDDGRNHYTLELYFRKVLGLRKDLRPMLVNAWGFEGWGQDKSKLPDKLMRMRRGVPVYAMTLMPPHRQWQGALAERGVGPVPVYLADDVWLYRFDDRPRGEAEPFLWELMTGLRLEGRQMLTHRFGPDDEAMVRVRFIETDEPHRAMLRWLGPGGQTLEQPIELPAKTDRAATNFPAEVLSTPGRWTVEVLVEGKRDTFLEVDILPDAVDRRYR